MRIPRGFSVALALTCLAFMIAGCSSGGSVGPVADGADASSGQSAAALLVQQWGQILWGLVAGQTGTQPPSVSAPTINPDGSISIVVTGPDGTITTITQFPTGSVVAEVEYADGSTQTINQSAPVFDGVSKTTVDWAITSSSGLAVDYTSVQDDRGTIFDRTDDRVELTGRAVLPTKDTQRFEVVEEGGMTRLVSRQSDGSVFTMDVPLDAAHGNTVPDFGKPTAATYRNEALDIHIELDSTSTAPGRWSSLNSKFGAGLTGAFSLGADFAGAGRLRSNGKLLAIMSWTATGETQVQFVSATQGSTSPAGAALDFLLHRWQTLAALLAPGAGATSAQAAALIGRGGGVDVNGLDG